MHQHTQTLQIKAQGRRLYDITTEVLAWAQQQSINTGLLTLYIQHTSASLLINENYDRDVLVDMQAFFNRLVPDGDDLFIHTVEGPDDGNAQSGNNDVNLTVITPGVNLPPNLGN